MKAMLSFLLFSLNAIVSLGQLQDIAFLGMGKIELKTHLENSSFITSIEENITKDGIEYLLCGTKGTWICAYYLDSEGECFQFTVMDIPNTENNWKSILDHEFIAMVDDIWKDISSSPLIYWRLTTFQDRVWLKASFEK